MNQKDLIESVCKVTCTKQEAQDAVKTMLREITNSLKRGERVCLGGLGTFSVIIRKAKVGRNPRTGQKVDVPAHKATKFKQAKDLVL